MSRVLQPTAALMLIGALMGCHGRTIHCPKQLPAGPLNPHSRLAHQLPDFWLRSPDKGARVLLDGNAIARHNQRVRKLADIRAPIARVDLLDPKLVLPAERFAEDLDRLKRAMDAGKRVQEDGQPALSLLAKLTRRYAQAQPVPGESRTVIREVALRCYPSAEGVYEGPRDLAFDLGQCAQLRFGELVRVFGRSGDYLYVRSSYGGGWVKEDALSIPLSSKQARHYLETARFVVVTRDTLGIFSDPTTGPLLGIARLGLRLPLAMPAPLADDGPLAVVVHTRKGQQRGWIRGADRNQVSVGYSPFSKRALIKRVFSLLHSPYGWGGMGSYRDCSRLLMDVFGSFGIELPRNSKQQALAGTTRIDVEKLGDSEKRRAIEEAATTNVVLLYLPGHIMLYLGRDGERLYAFHLFSGYLTPCKRGETMHRVNRAMVTSLELGRGSSRRAFIQRVTRLVLFGGAARQPARPAPSPGS